MPTNLITKIQRALTNARRITNRSGMLRSRRSVSKFQKWQDYAAKLFRKMKEARKCH